MAKVLGIDLGTTNSVMAVIEAGDPTISKTPKATA
jgi:molecular chaperone DnaK